MECHYAKKFVKRGKLKVAFLFMENEYTLRSAPEKIEGWVRSFIGDNACFPLWDSDVVRKTAQGIASQLEVLNVKIRRIKGKEHATIDPYLKHHKLDVAYRQLQMHEHMSKSLSPYRSKKPNLTEFGINDHPSIAEISSVVLKEDSLKEAWGILNSSANIRDQESLDMIMDEIGLNKADDLRNCEKTDVVKITKTLKKVQQKNFLDVLFKNKPELMF